MPQNPEDPKYQREIAKANYGELMEWVNGMGVLTKEQLQFLDKQTAMGYLGDIVSTLSAIRASFKSIQETEETRKQAEEQIREAREKLEQLMK